MIIEMLYPELSNLYGDSANIKYLKDSFPEIEIIETNIGECPTFLNKGKVDLVYRGTMTERGQQLFIDNASMYVDEMKDAIEQGQRFLVTGNAVEVFGKYIINWNMGSWQKVCSVYRTRNSIISSIFGNISEGDGASSSCR